MTKLHPTRREERLRLSRERRRVALCRTLLEAPDLLLLDEPTNHLDVETVRWLEEQLANYKGTVVVITHDRFFLQRRRLDAGDLHGAIPYQGNYSEYLIQRAKRMASQEQAQQKRAKFLERGSTGSA